MINANVHRRCAVLIVAFTLLIAARASGQDGVLAKARETAERDIVRSR